ncbi:LysR family transcriptional regulator [Sneathiella sp.]|uniref:LysR family transcriptional regulator n=1 Tax=Sneathiella sp. TaxID=1964365 RepID=UPI003565E1DB
MDIYQLRYFLAIVETNNFSRAAERAFVSQPTLSAGIKKLETELGASLFNRGSRKISLTEAGIRFLPHARTVIYECNAAKQEISRKTPVKRLQLGILRSLPTDRLAVLMSDFNKAHPDIQISLKDGTPTQLQNWLAEQRIDVALSVTPDAESDFSFEPLYSWKYCLCVPRSHPFAGRGSVPLKQLDRLDFVHRTHCETGSEIARAFANSGVNPHIVFRTDQDDKALAFVGAGLGLCMMPDVLGADTIAQVAVEGINIGRTIGLSWAKPVDNEIIQSFRLFAASHDWHPRRPGNKNLDWAR